MTIRLQDLYTKRNEIATLLQLDDNWPDLVDKLLKTNTNIEVLAAILMAYTDLSARNVIRIPELDALKREDVLPFYVYLMQKYCLDSGDDQAVNMALDIDKRVKAGEVVPSAELDDTIAFVRNAARLSNTGKDRQGARVALAYLTTDKEIVWDLELAMSHTAMLVTWPEHFYDRPRATYNAKYKAMNLTLVTRFYTLTTAKPC